MCVRVCACADGQNLRPRSGRFAVYNPHICTVFRLEELELRVTNPYLYGMSTTKSLTGLCSVDLEKDGHRQIQT